MNFIVKVKDEADPHGVADALQKSGLNVSRVLTTLGIVGGSGPATIKQALSDVPGVGYVREEGGFQLPPSSDRVPQ